MVEHRLPDGAGDVALDSLLLDAATLATTALRWTAAGRPRHVASGVPIDGVIAVSGLELQATEERSLVLVRDGCRLAALQLYGCACLVLHRCRASDQHRLTAPQRL